MTLSKILPALLVLFCCAGLTVETKAQAVTGYTSIDYYSDTDTLDAYSETDLDEYLVGDYDAYVSLTVRDQNGSILSSASAEDNTGGNGYITLESLVYGTTPGSTYTARGFHKAIADLWDYQPYYPYQSFYYDDYNFTYFEGQGIYAPWYYYFLSPGFQNIHRNTAPISVGSTYDYDSVSTPPGNPHHVQIINDVSHTTQPCDILERVVTYRIVDSNDHSVGPTSIRESDPTSVDTCSNTTPDFTEQCGTAVGTYSDELSADCPQFGYYDCGFDETHEKHLWCSNNGLIPLASFDYNVRHNRIIVSGYSGSLPLKWFVRADGSIQRR